MKTIARLGRWLGIVVIVASATIISAWLSLPLTRRVKEDQPGLSTNIQGPSATPSGSVQQGDERQIRSLFTSSPEMQSKDPRYQFAIRKLQIAGDWASISVYLLDRGTNAPVPTGGIPVLAHKTNGSWALAFKGTDLFDTWLKYMPSTLVGPDARSY